MLALASALDEFLLQSMRETLARDPNASIRMVVSGPPLSALDALFSRLTSSGASEWACQVGSGTIAIPVLLVTYRSNTPPVAGVVSGRCRWDYAVTVRNSSDRLLILVAPDAVDRIPESLANTTEVFGGLSSPWQKCPFSGIPHQAASSSG